MVMSGSGCTAYFGSPQRVIALLSEPRQMQQQAVELTAGALEPVRGEGGESTEAVAIAAPY